MENNKLFELLSTFDPQEFHEFGLFLDSPFHNTSKHAKALYMLIGKYFPDLSNKNLTKETIFSKMYPQEEYKDKKIRDLFSGTNKLAEEFLGYKKIQKDPLILKNNSLEELALRDMPKHFDKLCREIESELDKLKIRDDRFFYYNNKLINDRRSYYVMKRSIPKAEEFYVKMDEEIDQFVLYFASKMLYYYAHQFSQLMQIKHETHFLLLDELLGFLSKKDLGNYPYINVLYNVVVLLQDRSDSNAMKGLEEALNKQEQFIGRDLLRDAYTILFNCMKELDIKGNSTYNQESYRIIKMMVARGVLPIENNYIDPAGFITFAQEGLSHNDFEWSRNFIEEHYQKLRPEFKENYYNFTSGLLNYRQKKYDEAINLLSKVNTDNFNIYTKVKIYSIRIYFETKEYERAQNVVDSFRHHLNSNEKITELYKKRYMTYVSFMGRAITSILNEDNESLYVLKKEIENAPVFENRKWMIETLSVMLDGKQ